MNNPGRKVEWLVWAGLALVIATIAVSFVLARLGRRGESSGKALPVYGQVADFTLTNQFGETVRLAGLSGHVWVADIIFTRCPGPCLTMTRQMKEVAQALPADSSVKFVSLTNDPQYDTPEILKEYASRHADTNRWMFLTGSKEEIARLAIDSLKLTAVEKQPEKRESPEDLFIHSTIFVLVDRQGRLRGVFETMGEGVDAASARAQLVAAIKQLEGEK